MSAFLMDSEVEEYEYEEEYQNEDSELDISGEYYEDFGEENEPDSDESLEVCRPNISQILLNNGYIDGHSDEITKITTCYIDPTRVITASGNGDIIVWFLKMGKDIEGTNLFRLKYHYESVNDIALSLDGNFAFSGSSDMICVLWDLRTTGSVLKTFHGHTDDVYSVAISNDNRQFLSGSSDGTIRLWNCLGETKYTIHKHGHKTGVNCVRFAVIDELLFASAGKTVKLFDLVTCQPTAQLLTERDTTGANKVQITCLEVSTNGMIAAGDYSGIVFVWDIATRSLFTTLYHDGPIRAVSFSAYRNWLCVGSKDLITLWDWRKKQGLESHKLDIAMFSDEDSTYVTGLSFAYNDKVILVASSDLNIYSYRVNQHSRRAQNALENE